MKVGDVQFLELESGVSSLSYGWPLCTAARGQRDQQVLLERGSASTTGTEPSVPPAVTSYGK